MRAIVNAQKRDEAMRKKKRMKKKARKEEWSAKEKSKLLKKTMEWRKMNRLYPDTTYKQIYLRNIHPDLRLRFLAKCSSEAATTVGKLRYLMKACVDGEIDEFEINKTLQDKSVLEIFGPVPKGTPHEISMNQIPAQLKLDFKKWCQLRGYTVQGKLKRLMVAYIKGAIK